MKDDISRCIEDIEESILGLEGGRTGIDEVFAKLGLSHLKLPNTSVIALLDMLSEGITPVDKDVVTSFLGLCEAYKRLLFSLAGLLDMGAVTRPASAAQTKDEALSAGEPDEEKSADDDENGDKREAAEDGKASQQADKVAAKKDPDKPAEMQPEAISSIRVNTDKLDRLIAFVGKLMVTFAVISQDKSLQLASRGGLKELDSVIDQIKNEVEHIRLVPLRQIFTPMRRLVKVLSQKVNKKINLVIEGEDLELDKKIVEYINEPLVHLLRNGVDHGIETPDIRKEAGKPETGTLKLTARRKGEFAHIRVEDDGRGLDAEAIEAKARERGLWDDTREYTQEEVFLFIMRSGFSTAKQVTDVSGRGVGMDAVLNAIRGQLDGEVRIKSTLGRGTVFTLVIPLSRSVDQGISESLVCRVALEHLIIPSRDVMEVYQTEEADLVRLPDGRETVSVRGEVLGVIRLGRLLDIPQEPQDEQPLVVVVNVNNNKAAILVDEVLRQQQVVITNFTVPVDEIYSLPIRGFGMMGESDAVVVDVEALLEQAGCLSEEDILPAPRS